MNYFMLRSFDHAGYYETRLLLAVIGLAVALYFALRQRDSRLLVMFVSGVVFQAVLETLLQSRGLRGAGYSLSVFGVALPAAAGRIFQGVVEGGILSLMAGWFVLLRSERSRKYSAWQAYLVVCALIVVLASLVGWLAAGKPISSPRPMFLLSSTLTIAAYIAVSVLLCWWKGGLRYLGYCYLGLVIYVFLTFEPLHLFGARYIGERGADGQFTAVGFPMQYLVMFVSHLWEVAGGKVHYFAIPFVLGLIKFNGAKDEAI